MRHWQPTTLIIIAIIIAITLIVHRNLKAYPEPVFKQTHITINLWPKKMARLNEIKYGHQYKNIWVNIKPYNTVYKFKLQRLSLWPEGKHYTIKFNGELYTPYRLKLKADFNVSYSEHAIHIERFNIAITKIARKMLNTPLKLVGRLNYHLSVHHALSARFFINLGNLYAFAHLNNEQYPLQPYWQALINVKPFDLSNLSDLTGLPLLWLNHQYTQKIAVHAFVSNNKSHVVIKLNHQQITLAEQKSNQWPFGDSYELNIGDLDLNRVLNLNYLSHHVSKLFSLLTRENDFVTIHAKRLHLMRNVISDLNAKGQTYLHQFDMPNLKFYFNNIAIASHLHIDHQNFIPVISLALKASGIKLEKYHLFKPLIAGTAKLNCLFYTEGVTLVNLKHHLNFSGLLHVNYGELNFDMRPTLLKGIKLNNQRYKLPKPKPTSFSKLTLTYRGNLQRTNLQAQLVSGFFNANLSGQLRQHHFYLQGLMQANHNLLSHTSKPVKIKIFGSLKKLSTQLVKRDAHG